MTCAGAWRPGSRCSCRACGTRSASASPHEAGFSTVFLSGYCVSGTLLGLPDVGYLTQAEMADVAARVCAASPETTVVVDADTGYGNPLNVVRTVELWEQAGASGMFLEDQVWPKRCGHMAGKQVVPREDWLAKLRAAVDRRTHLHVTARTDARAAVGLDEALERARMARDEGVDALFVEAPESVAELERIAGALPGITLVANMVETGRTPLLTPAELADLGFTLIVSPLSALFAMVKEVRTALGILRAKGSLRDDLDRLVTFDDFAELVDLDGTSRSARPNRPPTQAGDLVRSAQRASRVTPALLAPDSSNGVRQPGSEAPRCLPPSGPGPTPGRSVEMWSGAPGDRRAPATKCFRSRGAPVNDQHRPRARRTMIDRRPLPGQPARGVAGDDPGQPPLRHDRRRSAVRARGRRAPARRRRRLRDAGRARRRRRRTPSSSATR